MSNAKTVTTKEETRAAWELLKQDAWKLGRVTIECGGDAICVDPRDRVRICDVGEEAADEYVNRKLPEMRKLVAKAGLNGNAHAVGRALDVYCEVGEKGHLEFSLVIGEG